MYEWLTRLGLGHEHYIGTYGRTCLTHAPGMDNRYMPGGSAAWRGHPGKWTDGSLLCRLVEKCERMSGSIPGTTSAPKNNAQKTQNFRRAFAELTANGRFPVGVLHEGLEEALLAGRRVETLMLFSDIKRAYAGRLL